MSDAEQTYLRYLWGNWAHKRMLMMRSRDGRFAEAYRDCEREAFDKWWNRCEEAVASTCSQRSK